MQMVTAIDINKNNPAIEYFSESMGMYLKQSPDAQENRFRSIKM
jgi:hypothetical protein